MHLRSVPEKAAATTIMQSSIQLKSVGGIHQEQGDLNQKVEAIAGNNVLFLARNSRLGYHGVLLVPSFETAGRGPETDYLRPSYALLNKGLFFTRSWAYRNKMTRSSILGPASNIESLIYFWILLFIQRTFFEYFEDAIIHKSFRLDEFRDVIEAYYILSASDGINREELSIEEYREVDGDVDCTRVMKDFSRRRRYNASSPRVNDSAPK
ncbi:hypothetical protein Tco_0146335 [Tanacetum coccineum]